MGWIIAALMTAITFVVVAVLWRRHQREVRHLRSSHEITVREIDDEHRRRLERLDREHDQELRWAHHPLARELFPALDSLDEALAILEEPDSLSTEDLEEGLLMARKALDTALERHGIVAVAPTPDDPFDPEVHEAIARHEDKQSEPNTIGRLFRRGYRQDNRVLRPALVEVNVAPRQDVDPSVESDPCDDEESVGRSEESEESPPDPSSGRVEPKG